MENNRYYVGIIYHAKRGINTEYREKAMLYMLDRTNYLHLEKGEIYTTNPDHKDYVEEDSLVSADTNDFRVDYNFLLDRYKGTHLSLKK